MKQADYLSRTEQVNDKTLPAFCIIFAIFVGGLILNTTLGTKIIDIGGFYMPAGIFLWSLTFPLTDIIAETYGRKYALYFVIIRSIEKNGLKTTAYYLCRAFNKAIIR